MARAARWAFKVHEYLMRRPTERPVLHPDMPRHRKLRVFTQDPSIGKLDGAICTLSVPNEPLQPGPAGAWFVVEDRDAEGRTLYSQVDLDAPAWLMRDGLDPSTTDRRFACQMVYAVAMETYARFTEALGRDPGFGPIPHVDGCLRILPRAFREANAYYSREDGSVQFGWDRASAFAGRVATGTDGGRSQHGGNVFIALSRDVIAHEISHALLDGLRPNFLRPTHPDVSALHEGFSDLVAIFLHFRQRDIVAMALEETQGSVVTDRLAAIGVQFGFDLVDGRSPLRTAVHTEAIADQPVAAAYRYSPDKEEHDLGSVLVSAVFEAYRRVFARKTTRLRRVFASYQGRLPVEGVALLADAACDIAGQFLNILIRAIDYCPSHHCTFGEYLRAMITADADLVPEDRWAYREALVSSFRRFGITVPDVDDLSEQALLWNHPETPLRIEALRFDRLRLHCVDGLTRWSDPEARYRAAQALGSAICNDDLGRQYGLVTPRDRVQEPQLMSLRTLRRVSPDGSVNFDLVAEIVQKRQVREGWFFGGSTLVIGADGAVRYAIVKHIDSENRLRRQRAWLKSQDPLVREAAWAEGSEAAVRLQRRVHRERTGPSPAS